MSADFLWNKVKTFAGLADEFEDDLVGNGLNEDLTGDEPRARRNRNSNIVGLSQPPASEMVIVEPRSFDDAMGVVEALRQRRAVIINLTGLDSDQAQRLIDFVSGATHAIDGNQERVGEGIFLFTPNNVVINSLTTEQPWLQRDARDLFWRVK